jgi:hypothetical protein
VIPFIISIFVFDHHDSAEISYSGVIPSCDKKATMSWTMSKCTYLVGYSVTKWPGNGMQIYLNAWYFSSTGHIGAEGNHDKRQLG